MGFHDRQLHEQPASPIDWSNLTPEQAGALETLMDKAAQAILSDIDGCRQRIAKSDPEGNWHKDAKSELSMWERLHGETRVIRKVALRLRLRAHRMAA